MPNPNNSVRSFRVLTSTKYLLLGFYLFLYGGQLAAHNGDICYALPIENISIDGDLSDWPSDVKTYAITNYLFGFKPSNDQDLQASMRIGYNLATQSLYVGVEVIDDEYIRNPDDPQWFTQDLQTLHLDLDHTAEGSGVIGYELSTDTAYIVHQKLNTWTTQVQKASWEDVEIKIKRSGDKTIYEWRVFLGPKMALNRTIGFDYMIIDKDKEGGNGFVVWGKSDKAKHNNENLMGDLILLPENPSLVKLEGALKWKGEKLEKFPQKVRLTAVGQPSFWVQAAVDSLGKYSAKVPVGNYKVSLVEELVFVEWDAAVRIKGEASQEIMLQAVQTQEIPPLFITKVSPPADLPKKGILHDFDQDAAKVLDQFVADYRDFYGIPGVSLALIKEGKVIYHQTYGLSNSMTKAPVHENTLFEAASITKPVFAYVVHRLVEKGIIDLDKPLYQYLAFDELESKEEYKLMTGRHVLRHLSGLPNWGRELQNKPGTKYGYSGEGFEYLKRVVAKITGKDIEQVLKEELLDPLDLYNIHFSTNETLRKFASKGHYDGIPFVKELPKAAGMAWSMQTEAKAFTKFALALLERKGLKPETYDEMMKMYNEYPLQEGQVKPDYPDGMGQGIAIRSSAYGKVFGHSGNNGDFHCNFEVYDELKMGYIIFTNANTGYMLHKDFAKLLVEGKKLDKTIGKAGK